MGKWVGVFVVVVGSLYCVSHFLPSKKELSDKGQQKLGRPKKTQEDPQRDQPKGSAGKVSHAPENQPASEVKH